MSTETPTETMAAAAAWTTSLVRRTGIPIRGALSQREGVVTVHSTSSS
ncbi:hypothetical protein [Halalkalicoccus salilacus]